MDRMDQPEPPTGGSSPELLAGVKIIDLCEGLAGSVAALLLAESGADVVKVEPPGGSPLRGHAGFVTWNRSKRSATLDVHDRSDRARLDQLLDCADVLIHDLAPSRASALGLDDAALAPRHPQLVLSSVLAWPANHEGAERPLDDLLTLARLGICDEQMPIGRDSGPVYVRVPFGSWCAAYLAAIGVMARLVHCERSGAGGPAHTSIVQGALVPMAMHWHRAETPSPALAMGMPKALRGSQATLFQCRDGAWIHLMPPGPDGTPLMQALLAEMGPERVKEANATSQSMFAGGFANLGANHEAMAQRTSSEWLQELWTHDVPAQLAAPFGSVLFDEQARVNDYAIQVEDADNGRIWMAGLPMTLDPPMRVVRAAPRAGEHTEEVLAEWEPAGSSSAAPEGPSVSYRWPLEGIKVLDFGNFLAGPYGPQVLADLGADVVKVESVTGDPMRAADWPFAGCQRGKRAVAVDLKSPDARPLLEKLVQWADIVHHNLRMPAARRLGLDSKAVRAINPGVVFCHVSSYGPKGPRADWPGYDQLFQAQCGWEVLGAGRDNPPMWHRFGFMDHLCALSSALATLMALHARQRVGRATDVAASLLGAGALTNSETFIDREGKLAPVAELDHEQVAMSAGRRLLRVADGWVAVAADQPDQLVALCRALGVSAPDDVPGGVALRPGADVLADLDAAGVASAPVNFDQRDAFFDDPANQAAGLVARYRHGRWGMLDQPGALWHFGNDLGARIELPPPTLGQHTTAVLAEVGVESEEIERLIASGVVAVAPLKTLYRD